MREASWRDAATMASGAPNSPSPPPGSSTASPRPSKAARALSSAGAERGSSKVRSSIYDGRDFVPRPEFEIGGESQFWDTALAQGRIVLVYYHRDDRNYDAVALRVECCPGCASPLPPHKLQLADPVLLFGRKITGLATLLTGDRLRLVLTRPTRIVWTSLPAATVEPEAGAAKLQVLEVHALWRNVVGSIAPTLLLFCSASLIFLGLTLLRERSRAAAASPAPEPPRPPSRPGPWPTCST
jgi:hypothetical protein